MKDITSKRVSLRKASAQGLVLCKPETVTLIKKGEIEKGDVFEFARAAAFLGAKNTQHLLPHCHPVNIDSLEVDFSLLESSDSQKFGIHVDARASSIGRTGIEMEVLTAVSIACLEVYDFLKPHDKTLEISELRLTGKTGGKSDKRHLVSEHPLCGVLICSDTFSADWPATRNQEFETLLDNNIPAGELTGRRIWQILSEKGAQPKKYAIVGDDAELIKAQVLRWVEEDIPYIFTAGGTGLGPRDVTIEAIRSLIEKEVPGIGETLRSAGGIYTPTAILSRAVGGTIGKSLVITLPGNPAAAQESLDALIPAIFHSRLILDGNKH